MAEMTQEEKQRFLDDIVTRRGFIRDAHRLLVQHDPEVMKAVDGLSMAAYQNERLLDERTKELAFILGAVCMRLPKSFVQSHIKLALDAGASKEEVLQIIELSIPFAGFPTFQAGLQAWAEAVGAERLEPSVQTYESGPVEPSDPGPT